MTDPVSEYLQAMEADEIRRAKAKAKVLGLFRKKVDSYDIAKHLKLTEAEVYSVLAKRETRHG